MDTPPETPLPYPLKIELPDGEFLTIETVAQAVLLINDGIDPDIRDRHHFKSARAALYEVAKHPQTQGVIDAAHDALINAFEAENWLRD